MNIKHFKISENTKLLLLWIDPIYKIGKEPKTPSLFWLKCIHTSPLNKVSDEKKIWKQSLLVTLC
jgi:hypothetical protein